MIRFKRLRPALAVVLAGGLTAFAAVAQETPRRRSHETTRTANSANRSRQSSGEERNRSGEHFASRINEPRRERSVADAIRWERYKERAAAAQARKEARSSASRSERR